MLRKKRKKSVDNMVLNAYNITSREKKERDLYPPD